MALPRTFARYAVGSPVTVMMRGVLEFVCPPERIDQLFREHALNQYEDELLFSSTVDVLSLAVYGNRKSVNDAYKACRDQLTVSVTSVYNKLKGTETQVSQSLVRDSAQRLGAVVKKMKAQCAPLVPGYRTKILDGNHLAATQHRLMETWTIGSAPLPGLCLVMLDPQLRLLVDVFPCEDGHAQERSLLGDVLETIEARDLLIADRNFCTTDFIQGIIDRKAFLVIRQHAHGLRNDRLLGQRRRIGECDTGVVYEQRLQVGLEKEAFRLRRVTIVLNHPTRDGAREMHILSNLPRADADALEVAAIYRRRWTIENAFQELGQSLHGEIKTLCYPKAALLAFCIALYTYNAVSTIKAAMRGANPEQTVDMISSYYLASELRAGYFGAVIAIFPREWTRTFAHITPAKLAAILLELARPIPVERFRKNKSSPKKPPPPRTNAANAPHVSTKRLLDQRLASHVINK